MKKYYAIVVDEKEYQLRLTVGGQRRLGEKYKTSPMEVLTTAAANAGMTADVLNEALHWSFTICWWTRPFWTASAVLENSSLRSARPPEC